jgi:hypothetical protein
MGSSGVVSIRVEALGVSITIADGSIAIEQTKTESPAAAVLKAEGPVATAGGTAPASAVITERVPPIPNDVGDSAVWRGSGAGNSAPVIDELEQAPPRSSPPGSNGPAELPGDSDAGESGPVRQTKPGWSDEKVEKLRALYPTHSASAIATQLGRGRNAVRSKAQNFRRR